MTTPLNFAGFRNQVIPVTHLETNFCRNLTNILNLTYPTVEVYFSLNQITFSDPDTDQIPSIGSELLAMVIRELARLDMDVVQYQVCEGYTKTSYLYIITIQYIYA